jgi:hypothetical protein
MSATAIFQRGSAFVPRKIESVSVQQVRLSFRYVERDIVQATRSHYASLLRPRLDIVAALE